MSLAIFLTYINKRRLNRHLTGTGMTNPPLITVLLKDASSQEGSWKTKGKWRQTAAYTRDSMDHF